MDPESELDLAREARHMRASMGRSQEHEAARHPTQSASAAELARRRAFGKEAPPLPADGSWRGQVQSLIPSTPAEADEGLPDAALQLEYVHGYRGNDCRDNVKVAADGRVVFPAAGVVVIHDTAVRKQEYFLEHGDDVVCLAAHPNGRYFASGEVGNHPSIFVWDSQSSTASSSSLMSATGNSMA